MVEIKIQKINEDATLPKYARPGDSGADLFSTRDYTLKPGEKFSSVQGLNYKFLKVMRVK